MPGKFRIKAAIISVLLYAFVICPLEAQIPGQGLALLEFASGNDIVIIRNNRLLSFDDPLGIELFQGDQIQTGKASVVELRFFKDTKKAGVGLLKMAENTTLVLERIDGADKSIKLVYGRVKAKVEKLAGNETFLLAGFQAVAGVRGTDFGMDVIAGKTQTGSGTSTSTIAYCFEGSIEIKAFVRSEVQLAESLESIPRIFNISAGEMVRVEGVANRVDAFREPLREEIIQYWESNDFSADIKDKTAIAAAKPEQAVELQIGPKQEAPFEKADDKAYATAIENLKAKIAEDQLVINLAAKKIASLEKAFRLQKTGLALSASLGTIGGAFALSSWILSYSQPDLAHTMENLALASSISAIPFLGLSLLIKP